MDMTKFENGDDPGFLAVLGELRRWTKELGTGPVAAKANDKAREVLDSEKRPAISYRNSITHNGDNNGQARVVYGGNMMSIATAPGA